MRRKHNVTEREIREVFAGMPKIRLDEKGDVRGENLYIALGRTDSGRYLAVFFILKPAWKALIITARGMNRKERRLYGKK
ncbi:MAG: BrnT family toxin [bacterium]